MLFYSLPCTGLRMRDCMEYISMQSVSIPIEFAVRFPIIEQHYVIKFVRSVIISRRSLPTEMTDTIYC